MLDSILQKLAWMYDVKKVYGVFLSLFDEHGVMIASQWTLETTKSMEQLIPVLYNALVWKETVGLVVVDIVKDIVEQTDKEKFAWLDMTVSGLCIVWDGKSGVLLPWTIGIASSKDALAALKKKYDVTGKIRLYSFMTDRIIVD
jgi:hypothetical protein